MKGIILELPLDKRIFLPLRLFIGGLCTVCGFDLEETEDLKVAGAEACLILKARGYETCRVTANASDGQIVIRADGEGQALGGEPDEFGTALLSELVDSASFENCGGGICSVTIGKAAKK